MKNKRLFFSLILGMLFVIFINTKSINIIAQDEVDTSSYENMKETIEEVNTLDEEAIDKYRQYVSVVDGKYMFSYTGEENEDVLFIQENINSINELVLDGEAYILEDEVILDRDEELAVQFGISNVKWKWYGVNFKMDRSMMVTVGLATFLIRINGAATIKNLITKGKLKSGALISKIEDVLKDPNTYKTIGIRTLNKTIILLDEKTGEITSVAEGLITAGIATYLAVQTAIACGTAGIGTIVTKVLNYVLGLFMPSFIDATLMFFGGTAGIYTVCNAKIRWCKGFGGYYSYY